jgi:hypothetical protein
MKRALAFAAVLGCMHGRPPSLHTARLTMERNLGGVRPFIQARVAGEMLNLVLDTGALHSVLPTRFALRNRLGQVHRGMEEFATDFNGHLARVQTAWNVPVQFDGEPDGGTLDFVVYPDEDVRQGVLTPQALVRPGWAVVIDLGGGELRYQREDDALRTLADGAAPLREVEFRRCLDEGFFERAHRTVAASINGVPTSLLVDTGASRTSVAWDSRALDSLWPHRTRHDDAIALTSAREIASLPDVAVDVAQTAFSVSLLVQPTRPFCGEGLLGADILDSCTLVWGWDRLWASCRGGK